jgi:hypothetical protein
MRLPGYKSMELLRRQTDDGEMEFVWVINFDTAEDLSPLRTEDNDPVSVPREAQNLLIAGTSAPLRRHAAKPAARISQRRGAKTSIERASARTAA